MLITLPIEDIQPGHYITRVLEQQGNLVIRSKGKVTSEAVIDKIKSQGVVKVEVDLTKSDIEQETPEPVKAPTPPPAPVVSNDEASGSDITKANDLYLEAVMIQGDFLSKLKDGAANDLSPLEDLSHSLIESIFDNPSAMSCLTMIKSTDKYLLEHSINCAVLMALFADHVGYEGHMLEELTFGALLMDIGMTWVPEELRNSNAPLTDDEWAIIRNHVDQGLELLDDNGDMPAIIRTIVGQHHERVDGSGYPNGLSGDEVSPFARMAAIVDTYDAMVSERSHQQAIPPAVALKRLTKIEGLDGDLVRQFIACIGIYPVGSLVRLKSGRLALVSKVNEADMMKPIVMTFYSIQGNHHSDIKRIDLTKSDAEIVSSVQPAEFKMNLPRFFREVFVHKS